MAIKAEIATVQFGPFSIEGLMSQGGDFGVAVPQAVELNLVPPRRSTQQLKALLGKGFESHAFQRWNTPLSRKPVNVLTLEAFQDLIRAMDKRGNEQATAFVDALFGLSLQQLFSDAFGQKFEAEDRQRYLTTRLATKHDFRLEESREIGSGQLWGYYAKGHHDPADFAAAVEHGYGTAIAAEKVRQEYARVVGDWSEGHRQSVMKYQKGPAIGAFKITVWEKP